jgi:hypothetical protein
MIAMMNLTILPINQQRGATMHPNKNFHLNDFAGLVDEIIPAFADSKWEDGILFKIADKIFGILHKVGLIKV